MKKFLSLFIIILVVFSFASCKKNFIGEEINKLASMATEKVRHTTKSKAKKVYNFKTKKSSKSATEKTTYKYSDEKYFVLNVVDGDTIKIDMDNDTVTVRLIGVDTPESVHSDDSKNCYYGSVASDYTTLALLGKEVHLEFDEELTDIYGRTLAYVFIDGEMFNQTLVSEGYAVAKEYPPNTKYAENFRLSQIKAQKNKVGMWSDDITVEDCPLKESCYIK